MDRIAVIINPIAGRGGHRAGAGDTRAAIARRVIARTGCRGDVILTRARGHATALARDFVEQGAELVIAWGGDGTVNDVAVPLIGTATALGIVRSGSGDGLARGLRIARDPERSLAAAIAGPAAPMDVGYLSGRPFLNVAGVGFDAAIAAAFNQRHRRGLVGYLTTTLAMVWTYHHERYDVMLGDERLAGRCFLVAFANGAQYGGNLRLAARVDPQDGRLDAVVLAAASPVRQLWRMRHLLRGVRRSSPGIRLASVAAASVAGDHLMCHVDGEPFELSGRADVQIAPDAIRVSGAPGLNSRRAG